MKGLPGTLKVFAGDKTSSLTSIWEKSGVQPNPDQWKNVTIEIPQFNNPVVSMLLFHQELMLSFFDILQ